MSNLNHLSKFKGTPGTITERQFAFLDEHGMTPADDWSKEQASLFIGTYKFCEEFLGEEFSLDSPTQDAVRPLLAFIIKDPELTDLMAEWDKTGDIDQTVGYARIVQYVESVMA